MTINSTRNGPMWIKRHWDHISQMTALHQWNWLMLVLTRAYLLGLVLCTRGSKQGLTPCFDQDL